jgi:hypothetical protein
MPGARSARASFVTLMAASVLLAAAAPFAPLAVGAFPIQTPRTTASPSSTPPPPSNVLPLDSTLTFVLDDTISSAKSKANDIVKAHLEKALIVHGTTVAPAGTPVEIKIVDAQPAENPDIYGFVDIFFRPMKLPDGRSVPLHAPASHLNVNVTAGHASTAGVENTIGDIFAPTLLLHVFRKGHNFVLEPGAHINARTDATIVVLQNGTVAIQTPLPIVLDAETPVSSFKSVPMVTPEASVKMPFPVPTMSPGPVPTF